MNKKVSVIYKASNQSDHRLVTFSPLPNDRLSHLDPFLLLNHHGPQIFEPNNSGLPFGPHPHRGIETVTFIYKGELVHQDSTGFNSTIKSGGVQWMTAGGGILHSEESSTDFKKTGGEMDLIQLWINLPGRLKRTPANYVGKQGDEIAVLPLDKGGELQVVSGAWLGINGSFNSLTDISLANVHLPPNGSFSFSVGESATVLFYVVSGRVDVNDEEASRYNLVVFDQNGTDINFEAKEEAIVLIGYGQPNHEPIISHGPFVMNTHGEIKEAIIDYHEGRFGTWPH